MIKIKRGLDLPIAGQPSQQITDGNAINEVAVLGYEYPTMKPSMRVREGDTVKKGQVIFEDKKNPGVMYTAPASGQVMSVNRGDRRVFESLVIKLDEQNTSVDFDSYINKPAADYSADELIKLMVESGMWTALRQRPYDKVPAIDSLPSSIFVAAIDTRPLAADPAVVIAEQAEAFAQGLQLLTRLTEGKIHVTKAPGAQINVPEIKSLTVTEFGGKHPAGLVGTHIHFLDGASESKQVWHIGYQDVIALAKLIETGELYTDRVVAIAGPQVKSPRLVRTQFGASLVQLLGEETEGADNRLISGSVLGGFSGKAHENYLGRYANQVSVLAEDRDRHPLRYLSFTGNDRHSVKNIYLSKLFGGLKKMTTNANGSERAMVPVGSYEEVMPLDILPTQLLRAIIIGDMDTAISLGVLELNEEDLSICTYVSPGKYEYGPLLRDMLYQIEKEG
ncbi:MAG: Na(+)-translocating NADH-quinone reductase subunit A [Pseudomonadota bacterium]|nr:Na(+)-translocating NADH-quinone reductase subunit A [Pseudomonadota bacterium]